MASAESLIEELYRDRYVGFRNALAPIVGSADAARDVVQEAFARALRDAAKLRRGESAAAWVWRIAFRIAVSERGRAGHEELPEDLSIRRVARPAARRQQPLLGCARYHPKTSDLVSTGYAHVSYAASRVERIDSTARLLKTEAMVRLDERRSFTPAARLTRYEIWLANRIGARASGD